MKRNSSQRRVRHVGGGKSGGRGSGGGGGDGSAPAGGGGGGVADMHLKMSKKIAQLTKVIYHLNSKNEDHEYEIRDLIFKYDAEIEQVSSARSTESWERPHWLTRWLCTLDSAGYQAPHRRVQTPSGRRSDVAHQGSVAHLRSAK